MVSVDGNASNEASWTSPGVGITAGYDGNRSVLFALVLSIRKANYLLTFCLRTRTSETFRIFIVFFLGLGIYNACVIIASALFYFKHYRGLYFWSLVTAGWGIIPYCVGFLIKFMNIVTGKGIWIAAVLVTMGKSVNPPPPTPCG